MAKMSRRSFIQHSLGSAGVLTLFAGGFKISVAGAQATAHSVRFLHTNDHHAQIEPISSSYHGGVSRRKTLIDAVRAEVAGKPAGQQDLLLLDAGDVFQGTLYFTKYQGLADLDFYKRMGYQAMAVGNHEFDAGQKALAAFVNAAAPTFPVLSANLVVDAASDLAKDLAAAGNSIKANTIFTLVSGKKVGVFGLTTPDTAVLSNVGAGVSFRDPVEVAKEQVTALQAAKVDYIIALTHLGYEVDKALAAATSGINVIIGGHSHTPLAPQPLAAGPYPTPVTNTAGKTTMVVTDWEWGRWLGDFVVSFDADGNVTELVAGSQRREVISDKLNPNAAANGIVTPDAEFEKLINDTYKPPIAEILTRPTGATANVVLNGERADVRTKETNLGDLVADAMLAKARATDSDTKPKVAITNGGGVRASIQTGDITYGEVLTVLPFGNTLARTDITGAQLIAALENGVGQVETAQGRFPQIAGFRFSYIVSRAPGSRVQSVEIEINGKYVPLDLKATYRVITNNFMLTGGDGYATFAQGQNPLDIGFVLNDVVVEYFASKTPITADSVVMGRIATNHVWLPVMRQVA